VHSSTQVIPVLPESVLPESALPESALPESALPAPASWSEGLNDRQRQAVEHTGGPLLILAGAGTGKTRTLVARMARLIAEGTAPERILLVTFSRRAADEMVRRAGALTDPAVARAIDAGTFHAMAHHLLRRYGASVGLGEGFSVLDPGDAADLMQAVRTGPAAQTRQRFARKETLLAIYSRVVNAHVPLTEALDRWFPWCRDQRDGIAEVFDAYVDRKRAGSMLDFDDLLLSWEAMASDPVLGPVLASRWDHVLVDEYQDTNTIQAAILQGTCRPSAGLPGTTPGLTVVGDDAQAIYSFRAATVRNLLDFADHFPGATTVTLDRNYRSGQSILDLANAVVADLGQGTRTALWSARTGGSRPVLATCPDEAAQADAVCSMILEHRERGIGLRQQVVLFRSAHHSDLVEVELRRRRVPFVKFGGLKFLEAGHVRDLLAALRVLDNPWDDLAWQRLLLLVEGVGPATAARLLDDLGVRPSRRGSETPDPVVLLSSGGVGRRATPAGREDELVALGSALADCARGDLTAGAQVDRLRVVLDPMVQRRYERADIRLRDLDALAAMAADAPSRARLVADLTLDPPTSTGDLAGDPSLDDEYVTLSTVHSAKGGEWEVVHVIHATDGMFPSDLSTGDAEGIDEERRLFYVALTRAKAALHVYAPLRYHHERAGRFGDRHGYATRSRFLPPKLDSLLELRAVRAAPDEHLPSAAAAVAVGIDERLRALW
jgi:DNA helicase-2/ATP-dependent DNA helicase PcrA